MDERYTRLFVLPENLYTKGSPVLIAAGTLLKDTRTGKVLAQLKLQNISPKKIRVVKVDISAFDTEGNAVAGVSEFSYLDLDAGRDAFFGSQTPIALPDKVTRSYAAQVTGVVFTDGTTWEAPADAAYAPLKAPVRLTQTLGIALTDQYRRQTFPNSGGNDLFIQPNQFTFSLDLGDQQPHRIGANVDCRDFVALLHNSRAS